MKHIFDKYHVITKNIVKMRTVPCKGLCYSDKDIHDKTDTQKKSKYHRKNSYCSKMIIGKRVFSFNIQFSVMILY